MLPVVLPVVLVRVTTVAVLLVAVAVPVLVVNVERVVVPGKIFLGDGTRPNP